MPVIDGEERQELADHQRVTLAAFGHRLSRRAKRTFTTDQEKLPPQHHFRCVCTRPLGFHDCANGRLPLHSVLPPIFVSKKGEKR